MLIVDRIAGNRESDAAVDAACRRAAADGRLFLATISTTDAQRGRMRVTADSGVEIGISLSRGTALRNSDVLAGSGEEGGALVVISVEPAEALAISFERGDASSAELFEVGVHLGHILGNQHWPMQFRNGRVLVPVTVDRKVMETVLRTYGVDGLRWEFIEVAPGTLPTAMPRIVHHHA